MLKLSWTSTLSGIRAIVNRAIQKLDTLKVLLMILWETKSLDNKQYLALSVKSDEIGRMLGDRKKGLEAKIPPKR